MRAGRPCGARRHVLKGGSRRKGHVDRSSYAEYRASRGPYGNQLKMDEDAGNTGQRRAASRRPIGILDLCRALQA